jgi:hypothetical protein
MMGAARLDEVEHVLDFPATRRRMPSVAPTRAKALGKTPSGRSRSTATQVIGLRIASTYHRPPGEVRLLINPGTRSLSDRRPAFT